LVVIGIMLVLIGLLIMGFRHVSATAARKETDAELHIARGMLTEYENHNGLQNIESNATQVQDNTVPSPYPYRVVPVYFDPAGSLSPSNAGLIWPYIRVASGSATVFGSTTPVEYHDPATLPPAPAKLSTVQGTPQFTNSSDNQYDLAGDSESSDMSNRTTGGARYTAAAVQRTSDVMFFLIRVPANRDLVQTVQSKRILEQNPANSTLAAPTMDVQGPVLLDGWGNPILFVPRGGIHVFMPDQATSTNQYGEYVVRSTGIFPAPNSTVPPMTGAERPFFASAGQDGDFTTGEDNVYSFQE